MNDESQEFPKGSLLICPELAGGWAKIGGGTPYVGAMAHYKSSILTALFLNRSILAPSSLPHLLREQHEGQLLELLVILYQTKNLRYITPTEDIELANEMGQADIKAVWEKGIMIPSNTRFAQLPGTDIRCALESHHSGTDNYQAAIANFILLTHQRYGCEYVDPISNADFSMEKFLMVKEYIWSVQPEPPTNDLVGSEEIFKFYIPYADNLISYTANGKYAAELPVLTEVIEFCSRHTDSLKEWRTAMDKMRESVSRNETMKSTILPISHILRDEMRSAFKKTLVRDLLLSVLTMPIPVLSSLVSLLTSIATKGYDYTQMKKSEERANFYFYVQSLSTILQQSSHRRTQP